MRSSLWFALALSCAGCTLNHPGFRPSRDGGAEPDLLVLDPLLLDASDDATPDASAEASTGRLRP